MSSQLTVGNNTFEKRVEQVEVTSNLPKRDPNWQGRCSRGHVSNWDTVQWWVDHVEYCPQCEEDHEEGHWVCPVCLEEIKPGMFGPSGVREFVPGMTIYFINGVEVDKDEYGRELAKAMT